MKHPSLLTIFRGLALFVCVALLATSSHGQTVKALSYNVTNSTVIWTNTNALTFVAPLAFGGTNAALHAAQTRTNLGLGATNDVTFRNVSVIENNIKLATTMEDEGAAVFIQRGTNESVFLLNLGFTNNTIQALVPIDFNNNTTNAATTRTNLGLPLAALTNTSNVTAMRALSGSTNTNHPFSGSVSVVGTNNTNTLVFSNGILQEVQ
jgi:hypothetical protein